MTLTAEHHPGQMDRHCRGRVHAGADGGVSYTHRKQVGGRATSHASAAHQGSRARSHSDPRRSHQELVIDPWLLARASSTPLHWATPKLEAFQVRYRQSQPSGYPLKKGTGTFANHLHHGSLRLAFSRPRLHYVASALQIVWGSHTFIPGRRHCGEPRAPWPL